VTGVDLNAVASAQAIPSTYRYEQSKVPRMRGSSADINKAISYAAYRLFEFMHVVRTLTLTSTANETRPLPRDAQVSRIHSCGAPDGWLTVCRRSL
jgi:hypothetical protein